MSFSHGTIVLKPQVFQFGPADLKLTMQHHFFCFDFGFFPCSFLDY
jgi:hypothetical protein